MSHFKGDFSADQIRIMRDALLEAARRLAIGDNDQAMVELASTILIWFERGVDDAEELATLAVTDYRDANSP